MSGRRVLIAGCGFLGAEIARRLAHKGWEVTGFVHSAESAAALAAEPFRVVVGDFTDPAAAGAMGKFDAVVHAASSRRGGPEEYRRVYLHGMQTVCAGARPVQPLFVSSTSVYAQTDEAWVTEETPAEPDRETSRVLRETEQWTIAQGGTVARLAGLYGPGRSVLLKKYLQGEARIEGDGGRWLNQIHRDDAAVAVVHLLEQRATGIWNVADNEPMRQRDLYAGMARLLKGELPPSGEVDLNRKRGWTSKRVSNEKLRTLGWEPEFPSFLHALEYDARLLKAARKDV